MKVNALLSLGPYRLRVRLIWLSGAGLVAQREKQKKKKEANPAGGACRSKLCCLSSVLLLLGVHAVSVRCCFDGEVDNDRLQTSRVKMSRLSGKACWSASSPPGRGARSAGPQLASAMVSMTCSSLPRSRCLRDCSSFCNADRIWTHREKGYTTAGVLNVLMMKCQFREQGYD